MIAERSRDRHRNVPGLPTAKLQNSNAANEIAEVGMRGKELRYSMPLSSARKHSNGPLQKRAQDPMLRPRFQAAASILLSHVRQTVWDRKLRAGQNETWDQKVKRLAGSFTGQPQRNSLKESQKFREPQPLKAVARELFDEASRFTEPPSCLSDV